MKNYYELKKQLELDKIYLDSLLEQREVLNTFLYPKTVNFEKIPVQGGKNTDQFLIYVHNKTDIDKKIKMVKWEISILQKSIEKMEKVLRESKSNTYRIFVYRYLDGLSVNEIAKKLCYSRRRIYQILQEVDMLIKK